MQKIIKGGLLLLHHLSYTTAGLGTAHPSWPWPNPHVSWPLATTILQCAASLAAGGYDRPCGPIESIFLLITRGADNSRPDYTAPSCPAATVSYSSIYRTPRTPSSLAWVQRTQASLRPNSALRLAFGQTESYSVQPRLPLAATISPAGRSRVFFY